MNKHLHRFSVRDEGAVSVEYVLLLAALISLSVAVVTSVKTGTSNLAQNVGEVVVSAEIGNLPDGADVGGDVGGIGGGEDDEIGGDEHEKVGGNPGVGNPGNDKDVGNAGERPGNRNGRAGSRP